jgi:hypothetical protein
VLSDPTQSEEFRESEHWKSPLLDFQLRVEGAGLNGPAYRSNSFSGNERNRLLLAGDDGFTDRSLVSGADSKTDARSFATLDFDGDGWLDIALASANAPRLQLFRNKMGDLGHEGRATSIRLVGSPENGSNRDAVGAIVSAGERVYRRSIGEGLAAVNSAAIRITGSEMPDNISVRWPSGKESVHPLPAGQPKLVITEP